MTSAQHAPLTPAIARQQTLALREQLLASGDRASPYRSGPTGQGEGQTVLVIGGTGYIGKAVLNELLRRNYRPVVLSRAASIPADAEESGVDYVAGDIACADDLEQVFARYPVSAVIALASSRRPNDAAECHRIDYQANRLAILAAVQHRVGHYIFISDFGVYRPELLPQQYKLQIEGELMGQHLGALDYTIIRPTGYFPYLAINYSDIRHSEPYRMLDHGEYNLVNPIAREDLAEFIVNQLFDGRAFGRILPVGGPWNEANVCTLRSAGELMANTLGVALKPQVVPLASWDRRIRLYGMLGAVFPPLRRISRYLQAARYWFTVSHVAPPYGQRTFTGFVRQLKAIDYDAGTFRERMKRGTSLTPDI